MVPPLQRSCYTFSSLWFYLEGFPCLMRLFCGASRGLGLGLARELATRRWTVLGTVRREADRAGLEVVGAVAALADITDAASLAALAPGALDLLFVNAGISEPAGVESIDEAGIAHLFLTNAVRAGAGRGGLGRSPGARAEPSRS